MGIGALTTSLNDGCSLVPVDEDLALEKESPGVPWGCVTGEKSAV